jgi:hypothetical protein
VVGVDQWAHAVHALRLPSRSPLPQLPLSVVEVWQLPFIAQVVGPEATAVMDEPARRCAAQVLQTQGDKAPMGSLGRRTCRWSCEPGTRPRCSFVSVEPLTCWSSRPRPRGLSAWLLLTGSTAGQLVNYAPCPVTVEPSRADELKHAADQAADTHPVHLLDGPVAQPAEAVAHGQHAVAAVQPEADRRTRTAVFIPGAEPSPCTTTIRNRCRPAG